MRDARTATWRWGLALSVLCVIVARPAAADNAPKASDTEIPPRPALPRITELKLQPEALTLSDARDQHSVLVSGKTESGEWIDLTSDAKLESASPKVKVDADGFVQPRSEGEAEVTISAAGLTAQLPVTVKSAENKPVRFVRDVMPIMSNIGCNQGTCHGSAKGKNGFKLSLRGYDPNYDYQALVDDLSGRRFNRVDPDQSLMLLKPTGGVPHEGGAVMKVGSPGYQVMRQWITEGLQSEDVTAGRVSSLEVLPGNVDLALPGMVQRMMVLAHYADGTVRDVTRDAILSSNQIEIALVKKNTVTGLRRGEAAVLVRYEGSYATTPIRVMGDRSGYEWKDVAGYNFIDQHIDAKLKSMKTLPSELCSDADFIRRASLDITGQPPTPEQVRAFIDDKTESREKRGNLVDKLLSTGEYVDFWTNKWADLLQCNKETLGDKGVWSFRNWIHQSIEKNEPYNKFVSDLLSARGSAFKNPATNFYRVLREPGKMTEDISQTFLGVRFNCAKCHDHPFERWTQNQYYEFGAFFAKVGFKTGQMPGEEIVYSLYAGGDVKHPRTDMAVPAHVPFGKVDEKLADSERTDQFVAWLTSKENPLFAQAVVNRVWSYFLGRGIIDPVDDIRSSNPPSNPELLKALTDDFVAGGYDLKKLMRTICASRTYQQSIQTNKWNEDDLVNFSHQTPRRLTAEQLLDAISIATGSRATFQGMPAGMRSVEVADGMIAGNDFLSLFGRPQRKSSCECERTSSISLSHAMNLINGRTISDALAAPDNRIAKLVKKENDDKKVIEEIYMAVLSRPPTEKEISSLALDPQARVESAQDLAWALMNSPAFLYNR